MTELENWIGKLAGDDEADRIYAAEDIGYANQAAGADALLARLPEEPSRAVREAIFGALLQIDHDAVITGVVALLDSEDSFLRNQAVELLQARGPKAIPFLRQAFETGDRDRRKFIVDVLSRFRKPGTDDIYNRALQDTDLNVVITAVENLGRTRNTGFRQRVEGLLTPQAHPMLLCASLEALVSIGEPGSVDVARRVLGSPSQAPGFLVPSYLKLLGSQGNRESVTEVAGMIQRVGLEPQVLNALTSLRNRFPELDLPGELIAPLCAVASRNQNPLLSYQALRLLGGFLNRDEVFAFMTRCLEHPEKAVRIGAVQALGEAGGEKAVSVLREFLARETDEEILQAWDGKQ